MHKSLNGEVKIELDYNGKHSEHLILHLLLFYLKVKCIFVLYCIYVCFDGILHKSSFHIMFSL